jgi:pheromone shutdown protein TraB
MLEAVDEAERVGARTIMIDRPIQLILREIGEVPLREKLKIGLDVVAALFAISTRRQTTELAKSDLDKLIAEFEAKYPTLFRILVKERDQYMGDRLQELLDSTSGPVIAVVGLGHVKGIKEHLALGRQARGTSGYGLRYEWTMRSSA